MHRMLIVVWMAVATVCDAWDVGTTYLILKRGGLELNPLAAPVFQYFGLTVGVLIIGSTLKIITIIASWIIFNYSFNKVDEIRADYLVKRNAVLARVVPSGLTVFLYLMLAVTLGIKVFPVLHNTQYVF